MQFFHADDGRGLGASHQTGWYVCLPPRAAPVADTHDRSGLVAYHILQSGANCRLPKTPKSKGLLLHSLLRELIVVFQQLPVAWPTITLT